MELNTLGNLISHRHNRVQRRHGVLENHGHIIATHMFQFLRGHLQNILALQINLTALNHPRRVGNQIQDGHGRGGLARAGLPYQTQSVLFPNLNVNAVDRMDIRILRLIVNNQILYFQYQIFCHRSHLSYFFIFGSSASRRPSPSKLSASTVSIIANPGIIHM